MFGDGRPAHRKPQRKVMRCEPRRNGGQHCTNGGGRETATTTNRPRGEVPRPRRTGSTTHEAANGAQRTEPASRDDAKQNCKERRGISLVRHGKWRRQTRGCKVGLGRDASGRAMCCPKCCRWHYFFLEGSFLHRAALPAPAWPVRLPGRHSPPEERERRTKGLLALIQKENIPLAGRMGKKRLGTLTRRKPVHPASGGSNMYLCMGLPCRSEEPGLERISTARTHG